LTPAPDVDETGGMTASRSSKRLAAAAVCLAILTGGAAAQDLGEFEGAADVGKVHAPGSVHFDARSRQYRITGGGENMWETTDGFHYLWRRLEGDLVLDSAVTFPEKTGNDHRKAGWVVRSTLDADAPYADAIVHADGLISLQYRLARGRPTREIQSPWKATRRTRVRLERTGDLFSLFVAPDGRTFRPVGSITVPLGDPVYAGLAVCSHDANAVATAVLSQVSSKSLGATPAAARVLESRLEAITVPGGERRVVYETRDHIEAPNWSRDGRTLIYNGGGRLFAISVAGGKPSAIDTGTATRLNNDHGLSRDGKWLAISHQPAESSLVYVLPARGGEPRQVTALGPSYWHGWSPDGKTLAYCASRKGEFDVYTIAASGEKSADEKRLTSAPGLDDGPEYAPDGTTIFFNSVRTGLMHIFRMNTDGSDQRQVTTGDQWANWFPHPSPDGKWLVFLSYDSSVKEHPANKDVALRLMRLPGGEPLVLARLFGGQGTINVPSWSPDSRSLAFVSYRLVKPTGPTASP
jgi:TolB protein